MIKSKAIELLQSKGYNTEFLALGEEVTTSVHQGGDYQDELENGKNFDTVTLSGWLYGGEVKHQLVIVSIPATFEGDDPTLADLEFNLNEIHVGVEIENGSGDFEYIYQAS